MKRNSCKKGRKRYTESKYLKQKKKETSCKKLNKGRNKIGNENVMPYVENINDMDPITYHILKYCLNSLYKCKKYTPRYHT